MPIIIREGSIEDSKGIATVHLLTWQKSYRDLIPHEKLDNYSIEEYTTFWEKRIQSNNSNDIALFVAEEADSKIVGFATAGRAGIFDTPSKYDCEIYTIYVLNNFME